MRARYSAPAGLAVLLACASPSVSAPADDLARLARDISSACPDGGSDVRDACGERLSRLPSLVTAMSPDGVLWGGLRNADAPDYEPSQNALTRLNGLVWSKLYLSLFAFPGTSKIETLANGDQLLRLDAHLRGLPPEDFPYPFWHSAAKWNAYHQARQVTLLFQQGVLVAGYRDAVDKAIPVEDVKWDGQWQWEKDGKVLPRASLYDYTLSKDNPGRAALEGAYRDFEAAARPYNCTGCHNPANPKNMNPLIFFTHPAQALVARHEMVRQIEAGQMPPPTGIADPAARRQLVELAERFAAAGDKALAFEAQKSAAK